MTTSRLHPDVGIWQEPQSHIPTQPHPDRTNYVTKKRLEMDTFPTTSLESVCTGCGYYIPDPEVYARARDLATATGHAQ